MSNIALLIIDFQNDYYSSFEGAKFPLSQTEAASANARLLLKQFRDQQRPVIHVRHESVTQDAPFFIAGSQGAEIYAQLQPIAGESVIAKQQINSFRETQLDSILKRENVQQLVIVGAMSHMCIDAATRAAVDLGYECHLAHDSCATLDLEFNGTTVPAHQVHSAFMAALRFGYCNVDSTENIMALVSESN